ncbi:MAG TPA: hypothetical protein VFI22_01940, partial [Thermomicrobiales bacterium]|nr:hypothetical protein [Thermomicrobiales bacterium]
MMDDDRFDNLARSLRSRRGVLAAALGGGLAAARARQAAAGALPVCLANGDKCDPADAAACCTRTCK